MENAVETLYLYYFWESITSYKVKNKYWVQQVLPWPLLN